MRRVVVVGASLAGVTAAGALREQGYDGEITLLGDERHAPYSRPPLSKAALLDGEFLGSVFLASLGEDVKVRLGQRAIGLDLPGWAVRLSDGTRVAFDGLIITTGSRARRLARPGQRGELTLRSLDDALALRQRLVGRPDVLVVGGGLLGMEIASSCKSRGLMVTVVARDPPLRRALGPTLSDLVTDAARQAGVTLYLSPGGAELIGATEISGVRLGDGRELSGDVIVTAAGDESNVGWLMGSGLLVNGALRVDTRCRATPRIVGAGDAVTVCGPSGALSRRPHWANAVDQARLAAASLLHGDATHPPHPLPYFWTHQFGHSLKIVGDLPAAGAPEVISGSLQEGKAVLQWRDAAGRPRAAASLNWRMSLRELGRLARERPG